MNNLIYPVSTEEFKKKVSIRFDNIHDGFNKFKHFMIEDKTEEEIINYIEDIYNKNSFDNFYIDLYLNKIDKKNEDKFLLLLSNEDKKIYGKIKTQYSLDTVYYKIDKSIIPFITRLSTREVLFCTIYATKESCTIWGNYDMKFPVFFK
ncbi:hypothetical protein JYG23_03265 [Sedimentibacter sp. zth1]|uniref:hypothetical protein n=1 Tax=Sedimentibacter sp. zth1 TaxID=2816908 RepID=UPI001A91AF11|nr:hypothetical protein [Sedimentibacter sp. zth1]QSX06492.1 hypothetical protein JYG23_03265 [Sedimentibacter sp. zth1]